MRRDTAGPGMESLTFYQANRIRLAVREMRRSMAGKRHEITHFLLSQRNQIESGNSKKETGGHAMRSLTSCQNNRTRLEVRTVRRDTAEPGMDVAFTCYQANRMRLAVRTVIKNTAGHVMESLTCCWTNRSRFGMRTERRHMAGPAMKSLTIC